MVDQSHTRYRPALGKRQKLGFAIILFIAFRYDSFGASATHCACLAGTLGHQAMFSFLLCHPVEHEI